MGVQLFDFASVVKRMIVQLLLIASLVATNAQTCVTGPAGADGADVDIVVTADHTSGCYLQSINGVITRLCNGTNGVDGAAATITVLTGVNAGCAQFGASIANSVCNGTTGGVGPKGPTGAAGPQGAPSNALITAITGTGCVTIAANGSTVLCNATVGAVGPDGAQGPIGATGAQGATGATGATGAAGSLLPQFLVIDGVSGYTYNDVGIATALCVVGCGSTDCSTCGAASTGTGGTVYIGANCATGTCTAGPQTITITQTLYIPSGVTLDLGGNYLAFPASSCPTGNQLVSATYRTNSLTGPTQVIAALSAAGNSSMGATTLQLPANSATTAQLRVGMTCGLNNIYLDGAPGNNLLVGNFNNGVQYVTILAFNNATGIATISHPLIGAWGVPANPTYVGTLTCWDQNTIVRDAAFQNGFISISTTCAQTAIVADGVTRFTMKDIDVLAPAYSTSQTIFMIRRAMNSQIQHVSVDSDTGSIADAFLIDLATGLVGDTIRCTASTGATAVDGLVLSNIAFSVFGNLHLEGFQQIGLYLSQVFHSVFFDTDLQYCDQGVNVGALQLDKGSRYNVFTGVSIAGSTGDSVRLNTNNGVKFNQFWGMVVKNPNGAQPAPILINTGAVANYFDGSFDRGVVQGGTSILNVVRQAVNSNGFTALSVGTSTPVAADFPANRMMAFSDSGESAFQVTVRGNDGVARSASVAVA